MQAMTSRIPLTVASYNTLKEALEQYAKLIEAELPPSKAWVIEYYIEAIVLVLLVRIRILIAEIHVNLIFRAMS